MKHFPGRPGKWFGCLYQTSRAIVSAAFPTDFAVACCFFSCVIPEEMLTFTMLCSAVPAICLAARFTWGFLIGFWKGSLKGTPTSMYWKKAFTLSIHRNPYKGTNEKVSHNKRITFFYRALPTFFRSGTNSLTSLGLWGNCLRGRPFSFLPFEGCRGLQLEGCLRGWNLKAALGVEI